MTCQELSDKMPAVARGLASWTDGEAAHLAACAECGREWTVVAAGAAVASGASLDAEALAGRVLHRLRTEPVVRRSARPLWLVGLAAAAAIAIIVVPALLPRGPAASPPPATAPLVVEVPGLEALGTEGLADVLESLETSWTETSTSDAPSLDDLDPQELERMERSWEI